MKTALLLGVLSIMLKWPVRDQWEYLRKMERHFPIKSGQPIEMALVILNFVTEFPKKGKVPVCQKWKSEFRSLTEICGPPPEVIPTIPVRRNRNEPFHLNSDQNLRNLWHNGKHPRLKPNSWV